jgi:hypothetical protein
MTRTNAALMSVIAILVTAFTAVPAAASDGYESVSAITGPTQSSGEQPSGYESVSAITGPIESESSPAGFSSLASIAGPESQPPVAERSDGYSSLASVVGPGQAPTPSVEVSESSGFDWGDALVGALVTMALALMAFGSARLIAHRRSTVESQA